MRWLIGSAARRGYRCRDMYICLYVILLLCVEKILCNFIHAFQIFLLCICTSRRWRLRRQLPDLRASAAPTAAQSIQNIRHVVHTHVGVIRRKQFLADHET
jgi:hypothetical protein